MPNIAAVTSLRIRYIVGLTVIALLVTASYLAMQRIISEQRNFARLVNLAGHQSGLSNRIAYFAGLMATTDNEEDFAMAKSQVGRTIHKMRATHQFLRTGDAELGVPPVSNDNLRTIFEDPMVGLDLAVNRYLERARAVYSKPMDELSTDSVEYIFLTTYGPHVLEPMFDSAVDEYERIGTEAIVRIEQWERAIWLMALVTLVLEALLIFRPLEKRISRSMEAVREERNFLQNVIDSIADPIMVRGVDGRVSRVNESLRRLTDKQKFSIEYFSRCEGGKSASAEACPRCQDGECIVKQALQLAMDRKVVEHHHLAGEREETFEVSISPLFNDREEVIGVIESYRNISSHLDLLKRLEDSHSNYAHLAQHDTLTGLPNRLLFNDRLGQMIHAAHRENAQLAVLFLDLDGFKLINDSYDHTVGDLVLKQVAGRISGIMREGDTFARMGGDEFTVVLRNISHPEDAGLVAQKILSLFREPLDIQGRTLFIGVSIGISVYPRHATSLEDLVRKADTAMYRAKEEGRNTFRFYSEGMTAKAFRRITLDTSLRQALENREFELFYQPQIDFRDRRVSGLEALVRWRHPQEGLIPPDEFIPMTEDSGLIIPLGEWVLREACRQMRTWLDEGLVLPEVVMCVNLSARQIDRQNLAEQVGSALSDSGLPARNLELEITESTMMHSADAVSVATRELRRMGVKIAIDDFGTGYSSLSHLKLLPITKLKIDKSFVSDIPRDSNDVAITRTIILLARSLSLEILAEGVETEDQLAFLAGEGCSNGQGYYFSPPLPGPEIEGLLHAWTEQQPNLPLLRGSPVLDNAAG